MKECMLVSRLIFHNIYHTRNVAVALRYEIFHFDNCVAFRQEYRSKPQT